MAEALTMPMSAMELNSQGNTRGPTPEMAARVSSNVSTALKPPNLYRLSLRFRSGAWA